MEYFDELTALFESDDASLFKPKPKKHSVSADGHLIESFSKITQFVKIFGRKPNAHSDDLNEAILGTQLNTIRSDKMKTEALEDFDELGLLELDKAPLSLDDLFSEYAGLFGDKEGIFSDRPGKVLSRAPRPVEDRAERKPVEDFELVFKNGFLEQQKFLSEGKRRLVRYMGVEHLVLGGYYIHEGQMLRIVAVTEKKRIYDRNKERFRVIYENGTESNMYRRSLSQRLRENGYKVVDADYQEPLGDDEAVGRIYVLASLSEDPKVRMIKNLHKIGVTTGSVANRIKNASNDPTYLMAPVHVLEDYRLTGDYNPQKIEALIHRIFGHVKVDLEIRDKAGALYMPSEWYSVPLSAIVEAIELIGTKEIVNFVYDAVEEKMIKMA